jgi:hypothetical protein
MREVATNSPTALTMVETRKRNMGQFSQLGR